MILYNILYTRFFNFEELNKKFLEKFSENDKIGNMLCNALESLLYLTACRQD